MARSSNAEEEGTSTSSSEADDILDSFLQDMSALDRRTNAWSTVSSPEPSKRKAIDSSNSSVRKTSKKKRLNPSWLKRKRELEALRSQAEALETRKEFLLSKVSRVSTPEETMKQQNEEEKKKCEAALNENKNLKQQLRNLSVMVQSLRVTEQLRSFAMDATRTATAVGNGAGYQLRVTSPGVFDLLEARLNVRFRELEASLTAKEPATISDTALVQSYSKSGGSSGTGTVGFKCTQLLPFAEDAISSTVWSFVEFGGFPDDHELHVSKRSENTCAIDSKIILRLGDGGHVILNEHRVIKRFRTPNGIVLMSESSDDWAIDQSSSWVHTIEGRACFVIRNCTVDKNSTDSDVSEIHAEVTLNPDAASVNEQCQEARKLNVIAISKSREMMESRRQFVENTLFDRIRDHGAART